MSINSLNSNFYIRSIYILRIFNHIFKWVFNKDYSRNHSLIIASYNYHYKVSYFFARYIYFLFKPVALILKKYNFKFSINNISNAVGHIYPEVDYLYRMKRIGIIKLEQKIICIWPKSPVSFGFAKAQKDNSIIIINSGLLHILIYPLLLRYTYLTLNSSQSSINHRIFDEKGKIDLGVPLSHMETFRLRQREYARVRGITLDYYPLNLHKKLTPEILGLIGTEKYFLIQIKDEGVNATFKAVEPETYLLAIEHLKKNGYNVVMAGREKIPDSFLKLNVINYAGSDIANSFNDYLLVQNAIGVLASASGFSYIADTLGIPLLSINNWHINGYPGKSTIQILSLININDKKLSFIEQLEFSYELGKIDINKYKSIAGCRCFDASSNDILRGIMELLEYINLGYFPEMTQLQKSFNKQFVCDLMFYQKSRISQDFLIANADRF